MMNVWKTLLALLELERGSCLPLTVHGSTYLTPTKLLKVSDSALVFHAMFIASFILFIACVVKGSGVCFPIVAKCEPRSILPDYIVNQDIHFLDEVLVENRTRLRNFGIVYNRNQSEYEACFMNVTQDINFVEFCLHHSTCTSSMPSVDGEFTILKSAKIKVGKGMLNK